MLKLIEVARFAKDVEATTAFYENLLGSPPTLRLEGMSEFQIGNLVLRIHRTYASEEGTLPAEDHIAFAVDDVDWASDHAEKIGLAMVVPPTDFDWGRSAYLRDPDGRLVELHQS